MMAGRMAGKSGMAGRNWTTGQELDGRHDGGMAGRSWMVSRMVRWQAGAG